MKKLMSMMLGLTLVLGCASFAFAEEKTDQPKKEKKAKSKKSKKADADKK